MSHLVLQHSLSGVSLRPKHKNDNIFITASTAQQTEWHQYNLTNTLETSLLESYFKNISVEEIIENYSFKDKISQKIFASTIINSEENEFYSDDHTDNQLDEVLEYYNEKIQKLSMNSDQKFETGKCYPNLMDKRNYQIQQLLWNYVANTRKTNIIYKQQNSSTKEINNEIITFFYIKSFLDPEIINFLPPIKCNQIINEILNIKHSNIDQINLSNSESHQIYSQFIEFTWEITDWLIHVINRFKPLENENENAKLLLDCYKAVDHLCSFTNDGFCYYLMINDMLINNRMTNTSENIIKTLENQVKKIQGPRTYFPYCLLEGNLLTDSGKYKKLSIF